MKKYRVIPLLVIAVILAVFISPLASSSPDGLEWVASIKGFLNKAEEYTFWNLSIMPDYKVSFIKAEGVSTSMAGLLGTLVCFVVAILLFRSLGKKTNENKIN